MSDHLRFVAPDVIAQYGFSCKVWLAYQMERHYLDETYFVWYARELNPVGNGDSSNPLEIYQDIDRAVKANDHNHPKIKDLRAGLLRIIDRFVRPKDRELARALKREVVSCDLAMFRPQIWRLDLRALSASRIHHDKSQDGWDEQYLSDLRNGEFEVIVPWRFAREPTLTAFNTESSAYRSPVSRR